MQDDVIAPIKEQATPAVKMLGEDGRFRTLAAIERDVLRLAISEHGGSVGQAARSLGIGRSTLYRRLPELLQN
jgi:transcriptional regulator of acetoin/glycerol metabolism